jgi:hypothetical protein
MPSVVCFVEKEIQIGAIEKEMVLDGAGSRYFIGKDSDIVPYGKLKKGTKCQLRHGFNGTEQRVYIACREGSGWFMTNNVEGYSLNEVFSPVRKNRSPWEALH